jgi:hypothetical protein
LWSYEQTDSAQPTVAPVAHRSFHAVEILKQVFSFPAMLAALLVTAVFWAKHDFNVDTDFWWHLKVGEDLLATHHWPTADPYSYTAPGQPWIAAEWLGEVLFAGAERVGGLSALYLLLMLMGASIVLALYTLCTLRSGNSKASFAATATLTILALPVFHFRPQMLGFLFLVLTLIALERFRQGHSRALWFLPFLFLLWVNTHGSWTIGLFCILVYWASGLQERSFGAVEMRAWTTAQRERLLLALLLCLAVLPITPYGTRLAVFPVQFIGSLPINMSSINEWQPMPFDLVGAKLFLVLLFLWFGAQLVYKTRWRLEELTLYFLGIVMACLHVRFLLVFVPFFAPLFAVVMARWIPAYERQKDRYLLNAMLMTGMLAGVIHFFPTRAEIEGDIARTYPSRAIAFMRAHPVRSPIFNTYGFGGYIEWSSGGREKVFIDGRGELFEPGGVFADYRYITTLRPGALAVLNLYHVQTCLFDRDKPLAVLLASLPEWKKVYEDDISVVFVRQNSADGATAVATVSQTGRQVP